MTTILVAKSIPVMVHIHPDAMAGLVRLVEKYGSVEGAIDELLSYAGTLYDPSQYIDRIDWSKTTTDEITVRNCFGPLWYAHPVDTSRFHEKHGYIGDMQYLASTQVEEMERLVSELLEEYFGDIQPAVKAPTWGELRAYARTHYYPKAIIFTWLAYRRDDDARLLSQFLGLELPEIAGDIPAEGIAPRPVKE